MRLGSHDFLISATAAYRCGQAGPDQAEAQMHHAIDHCRDSTPCCPKRYHKSHSNRPRCAAARAGPRHSIRGNTAFRSRRGSSKRTNAAQPNLKGNCVGVLVTGAPPPRTPRVVDCLICFSVLVQPRSQVVREYGRLKSFLTTLSCVDTNWRTTR
jgi:hypothetical protein